jgi:hypothetical protein
MAQVLIQRRALVLDDLNLNLELVISVGRGINEKLRRPPDHTQVLNIVALVINELERSKGTDMGRPTGQVTDH